MGSLKTGKRQLPEHNDTSQIESQVRVAIVVFVMIQLILFFGTLVGASLAFLMPKSSFFQGMLFGFVGIGVWSSKISACVFSIVTICYPGIKTFFWFVLLVVTAAIGWIAFASSYTTYLAAIHASITEMFFAIFLAPNAWWEYSLAYRIARLRLRSVLQ